MLEQVGCKQKTEEDTEDTDINKYHKLLQVNRG